MRPARGSRAGRILFVLTASAVPDPPHPEEPAEALAKAGVSKDEAARIRGRASRRAAARRSSAWGRSKCQLL